MTRCAPRRGAWRGRGRRTTGRLAGVGAMAVACATTLAAARREALPRRQKSYGDNAQHDTDEGCAADPLMVDEDAEQNRPDA